VLGIEKKKIDCVSIPVPRQGEFSNDCGLYAVHFLRIFLGDVPAALQFCEKVSSLRHSIITLTPNHSQSQSLGWKRFSSPVQDFWHAEMLPYVREDAVAVWEFYRDVHDVACGRRVYPRAEFRRVAV